MSGVAVLDGIDDRDIPKMELLTAAFHNEIDTIERLMNNSQVHIDSTDDDDVTALQIAAATGNNALVKRLLDYGANIDACNQLGFTAFHHAAREGKLAVIDTLLQRGADHAALTYMGVTALTLASAGGHADVVKRLLSVQSVRSSVARRPARSLAPTALIAATYFKSAQICSYLHRAGVALDETIDTLKGLSALSTAILCTPGVYMVTSLLDLGASQSKRSLHRQTALQLAKEVKRKDVENVLYEKRSHKNKDEPQTDIRQFITENILPDRPLDRTSQDGCTLLMFATIVKSVTWVKVLLSNNIDINARDNMHISALQIASLLRFDELVHLYLTRSAQTANINKYGVTAYDLFLNSCDILPSNNLRAQLNPFRPPQLEISGNFSSSSSTLYKTLQPKGWFNKMSTQIFSNSMDEMKVEPKMWHDAITHYQPAKDRNSCKFASVEEILRGTKTARAPETNPYDMMTDALRGYMEEFQSFMPTCFSDTYGEKEGVSSPPPATLETQQFYDIAQQLASRMPTAIPSRQKFPRNSLVSRRQPRTLSMVDAPSQNQMRTTPRVVKRRDVVVGASVSAETRRVQVPTVVVRTRPVFGAITDEMIWSQLRMRNRRDLMEKLKKDEIDRYSFMSLNESNFQEMGIIAEDEIQTIKEVQRSLRNGSL